MKVMLSFSRTIATSVGLISFIFGSFCSAQQQDSCVSRQNGPPANQTNYYALVIGDDNYAPPVKKLKTAVADACEVERVLREVYNFRTNLLINATRAQIVNALATYRRELGPESNLVVYYAGHGFNDKEAHKAYWLPVDATQTDTSNWIIADEITTDIRVVPARHVLVISDSCYSGTLARGLTFDEDAKLVSARERFLQKMAAGHSRTLMASGGDEPVSDTGGNGHSVFASALLRGLRQFDKPQFTAAELFSGYVIESVAGKAEQTPVYDPLANSGHESGDFVFARIRTTDGKAIEVGSSTGTAADPTAVELNFWERIRNSTSPDDFKAYLAQYPTGRFVTLARIRLGSNEKAKDSVGAGEVKSVRSEGELLTEAELLLTANASAGVERAAGEALVLYPQSGRAYRLRAEAYFLENENEKGDSDKERVLGLLANPHGAEEYEARGWGYLEKEQYELAIADLTQAIKTDPKFAIAYVTRGNAYADKKEYDLAIADLTLAVSLAPKFSNAYSLRGDVHRSRKEYDSAIADYTQAISLGTKFAGPYNNRGNVYLEKKEYDLAIADFTQVLGIAPNPSGAYGDRAHAYYLKKEYGLAIADLTQAIGLNPKFAANYYNRGLTYAEAKEYDLAISDYTAAIRLDPKYTLSYSKRGISHFRKNEYDLAIADYTVAISLDPKLVAAYLNRADAYEKLGDMKRATADRKTAETLSKE